MGKLLRRLAVLLRWRRFEADLDEELRLHRDMTGQRGNSTLAREESRAIWRPIWFEDLRHDVRYALRMLRLNPTFSAVAILTLALGIGMNTAVFSVFNAVLLRPLSFHDPERLVWISLQSEIPSGAIPATELIAWREQATSFERLVAYENTQDHTIQTDEAGTQARNTWVTDDFWALAGVRPELGRLPEPGESDVVVLSHAFFERWFRGDRTVVGRAVTVNGRNLVVIGVLAREFRLELPQEPLGPTLDRRETDLYRQYGPFPSQERGRGVLLRVVGKLQTGVSLEDARAELETIRGRLAQVSPQPYLDRAILELTPLTDRLVGSSRRALWVLLAAVSFVLLIGCANIANLLLARTATRQREIAIRMAVGAGRARVLRQFLTESLVIALLGAATGLVVAQWAIESIVRLMPQAVPRLTQSTVLDSRVLVFMLGTAVATTLIVGIAPVASLRPLNTLNALKDGASTVSTSLKSVRVRRLLVGAELALAIVLLTGASLMLKSFWRMNAHPPGFEPERVLTLKVMFSAPDYVDRARRMAYVDEFVRRLPAIPGVQSAGITTAGASPMTPFIVEGTSSNDPERRPTTPLHAASAGYMRAMGMRLERGRWFSDAEPAPVVVITGSVARREFGSDDPIGTRIQIPGLPGQAPTSASIVGVVGDLRHSRLDADPLPEMYIPYRHHPTLLRFTVIARTPADPLALAPSIQAVLSDIDKTLPVFDAMTLQRRLADSVAPRRFNLFLLGAFAGAALLLALVGVYGVIAFLVAQRTHEIGVRVALGARRADVVSLVVQQSVWMIGAGTAAGLVASLMLTRLIDSLLYEVDPTDPQAFALALTAMAGTAIAACLGPTLKACRVDPIAALRYE